MNAYVHHYASLFISKGWGLVYSCPRLGRGAPKSFRRSLQLQGPMAPAKVFCRGLKVVLIWFVVWICLFVFHKYIYIYIYVSKYIYIHNYIQLGIIITPDYRICFRGVGIPPSSKVWAENNPSHPWCRYSHAMRKLMPNRCCHTSVFVEGLRSMSLSLKLHWHDSLD